MKTMKSAQWVVNPSFSASVNLFLRKKQSEPISLQVPIHRDFKHYIDILAQLSRVRAGMQLPKSLQPNLATLIELGLVVPKDSKPMEVNPSWKASVSDLVRVPEKFRFEAEERFRRSKMHFNKDLVYFQKGALRPAAKQHGIPSGNTFPQRGPLIWVFNPASSMWAVFQFSKSVFDQVERLRDGSLKVSSIDEPQRELLLHAGIIGERSFASRKREEWKMQTNKCRREITKDRYTIFREMINPLQIAVMRSYFLAAETEGYLQIDTTSKRFVRHNDPLLRYVHRQSGELARQITGQAVVPSYSFLSAYMEGARLRRHTDRPQCVWNGSLLIEQSPKEGIESSWPIFFEIRRTIREIRLDFGDAVFYSGTDIPHWRNQNRKGHRQTLGLLHYVPLNFVGSLD